MNFLSAALLTVVLTLGWAVNLIGLPGNWIVVVAAALYAFAGPTDGSLAIGWQLVVALALLAVGGEVLELIAGAFGVKRVGGSRRGAVLALVGSLVGGIVGMFVGVPIPIIGPIVAAVLFAGIGALAGALLGENWKGRDWQASWEIGKAAFWGRLFGTLAKALVGLLMVVLCLAALFV